MGLIYEIGKVNSELNTDVIGTLVSDTYGNYHGAPPPSFPYSNDLYPDNFGIDVGNPSFQGREQHFLFIRKKVIDTTYGKEIIAELWKGWAGKCWGVVELGDDSFIEIFTNFSVPSHDWVKNFKGFNIPEFSPFNTNFSIQFAYFNRILYLDFNESGQKKGGNEYGNVPKFRFAIRIILDNIFNIKKINVVFMDFNGEWTNFSPFQARFFTGNGENTLGLKLVGNVKLYDFYFV